MSEPVKILCIIGPTASGKSSRAVEEALARGGEIISVDSRQVYTMLDIGSEKISEEEMRGVPHHLMSFQDPRVAYSAGDFVKDAAALIKDIHSRGKLPILAGGTLFYFDALLNGLPEETPPNETLREELELLSNEALFEKIKAADPDRAEEIDPDNRRRLIRALEVIDAHGSVPKRVPPENSYTVEWVVLDPSVTELKEKLAAREALKFDRGLIEEVQRVREHVGDERLNELGLEYRIVGEYLRGERTQESLLPALNAKLWQYARRQKAWMRKITSAANR